MNDVTAPTSPAPIVPAYVSVVDINMPFMSIVGFMIKWALAAIPAVLILAVLVFFVMAASAGVGGVLR